MTVTRGSSVVGTGTWTLRLAGWVRMEAMKMEQTIVAETSGVVAHFLVETGGFIDAEEDLIGLD